MNRALLGGMTSSKALAINGNDFIAQRRADGSKVSAQAIVKMLRGDEREDIGKGLSSGNAMGKCDPFLEPLDLSFTEVFNFGEVVHAAESCHCDHKENFTKVVLFVMARARIFNDLKYFKPFRKSAAVVDFV